MLNNFKNILIEIDKEVNKFNLLSNNYENNNLEGLRDIIINLSNKTFEVSGPLDQFNVTALVGLKFDILGKFYLALTNISLYLALVLTVIISIFYYGDNDSRLIPNK